jgi:nicotinamide phosphoribosyltransferase
MSNPLILSGDSYKYSHPMQYPPDLAGTYFYITARTAMKDQSKTYLSPAEQGSWVHMQTKQGIGLFGHVVYMGLQAWLKKYIVGHSIGGECYLPDRVIPEAQKMLKQHGVPFYERGFKSLRDMQVHSKNKNGKEDYWPINIAGLEEGSVVPVGTPLVAVQSLLADTAWLPSFVETSLLRGIWYPTTVATNAWKTRRVCKYFLEMTMEDPEKVDAVLKYMLHDFGSRGVSSAESSALGGIAHLTQFYGTDNLEGLVAAHDLYHGDFDTLGHSCPAAEHSTIMAWGPDREAEAFKTIIGVHQDSQIVSVVSDTYSLQNALKVLWGKELVETVKNSVARVVVRPDSGDPVEMVMLTLRSLKETYGAEKNKKGFYVLPPYLRVIQGDGVNLYTIFRVLQTMVQNGFSAENIVFGQGGALLQQVSRDDYGMAMKLSAIQRWGSHEWVGVKKTVATDSRKVSRAGRFFVQRDANNAWTTVDLDCIPEYIQNRDPANNALRTVWNGRDLVKTEFFDTIRKRARAI